MDVFLVAEKSTVALATLALLAHPTRTKCLLLLTEIVAGVL